MLEIIQMLFFFHVVPICKFCYLINNIKVNDLFLFSSLCLFAFLFYYNLCIHTHMLFICLIKREKMWIKKGILIFDIEAVSFSYGTDQWYAFYCNCLVAKHILKLTENTVPFQQLLHQGVGEGITPFPGLLHFTFDRYLILLSVKQGGIKYHF